MAPAKRNNCISVLQLIPPLVFFSSYTALEAFASSHRSHNSHHDELVIGDASTDETVP